MKEIEIKLSFKSRLYLFYIEVKTDWAWRKVYGFPIMKRIKELFFPPKHYALFA